MKLLSNPSEWPMNIKSHFRGICCLMLIPAILLSCKQEEYTEQTELAWNEGQGYRWADIPMSNNPESGFLKIPSSHSNVDVNNFLPEELMNQNRVLMNGSGVAAGDVDGDGLIDLYFARIDGANALYRNLGGFQFEDITEEAGVALEELRSTGVVFADVNGNGHLDLLVTAVEGENVLFLNDGSGHFTKQENSGLREARGSMTMALADVNNNGFPDLYVVNYRETNVIDEFPVQDLVWENTIQNGELIPPFDDYFTIIDRGEGFPPERHEIGRKDELYLNNGDGTFTLADDMDVFRDQNGKPIGLSPDWGLSAKFHDLNGNGLQDLYVSNDFWTPDRIWINQGDGTFQAIDSLAVRNSSYYSMTVDFADINKNGFPDIFTVEMLDDRHSNRLVKRLPTEPIPLLPGEYRHRPRYNRNSLYLNRGDNTYAEIAAYSGLHASEWSWSTRFMDIDLDGHEDVIILNGFAYDFQNLDSQQQLLHELIRTGGETRGYVEDFTPLKQQNRIFLNNGNLTFSNVSTELGFTDLDISLGLALVDLDNDGAPDLVISRMNDEPAIYKNVANGPRVAIRLIGKSPNTQAIGAEVELIGGLSNVQKKQVIAGGDYLSGSDPLLVFAVNPAETAREIVIRWPDGKKTTLSGVQSGRLYEIYEGEIPKILPNPGQQDEPKTLFKDISHFLGHRHHEDAYHDPGIQPLLPVKLSHQGPGVGFADLTGNGTDELIIGSGKGAKLSVFEWMGEGSQLRDASDKTGFEAKGDQTGMAAWKEGDRTHLMIGNANYEIGSIRAPSSYHIQIENGEIARIDSLPGVLSTTGPVAAADYTGDGQIDVFIGGRFMPGQYPADASSRLFRREGGKLILDTENEDVLKNAGLVTSAVFVDYNQDGFQDLILTTEWGSIKLFENNGEGKFTEHTEELGLSHYKGLWQGIAVGDFNHNGYPDLAVTNWGENNFFHAFSGEKPLRIYYGDFNRNRRMDMILAYYDEQIEEFVPMNKLTHYESIEDILRHAQSHQQFANFSVSDMLRRDSETIPYKQVTTFQHMVFLNREGEGFEPVPLPVESQFAPGFYIGVADMDNDGKEDLFMAQNFFSVTNPQTTPRLDAGRGLWLKGDGNGTFTTIPGHESGIKIYGEQRGSALGDLNGDGKTDLAVSQNAGKTRLFLNQAENRGITITLQGPEKNRSGVGAELWLMYKDGRSGPKRFVSAGSGYWSQNSTTQIMGFPDWPESIMVKWSDGRTQTVSVNEGIWNYSIKYANN